MQLKVLVLSVMLCLLHRNLQLQCTQALSCIGMKFALRAILQMHL